MFQIKTEKYVCDVTGFVKTMIVYTDETLRIEFTREKGKTFILGKIPRHLWANTTTLSVKDYIKSIQLEQRGMGF